MLVSDIRDDHVNITANVNNQVVYTDEKAEIDLFTVSGVKPSKVKVVAAALNKSKVTIQVKLRGLKIKTARSLKTPCRFFV